MYLFHFLVLKQVLKLATTIHYIFLKLFQIQENRMFSILNKDKHVIYPSQLHKHVIFKKQQLHNFLFQSLCHRFSAVVDVEFGVDVLFKTLS